MSIHITQLVIENFMRLKAFTIEPKPTGLTIIGGANGQGKSTALRAIQYALGGAKYKPGEPHRDGAMSEPVIDITFSNGIRVQRTGKNNTLKVTDTTGQKAGQGLLDSFLDEFALNLPKFMAASSKEKAQILLGILGIGPQLAVMEKEEKRLYDERHGVGQVLLQKKKYADELPEHGDAPDEPVSMSELLKRHQAILAKNGENQRLRGEVSRLLASVNMAAEQVRRLELQLETAKSDYTKLNADLATAQKSAETITDESTAEIESDIESIESINAAVAANRTKSAAIDEAQVWQAKYDLLTEQLETTRRERAALLEGAELPYPGLSVIDGELTLHGHVWDDLATSEQYQAGTAIVRKLQPNCSLCLLDRLETLDPKTLMEFDAWIQTQGLQIVSTRVSTGDECSIIIEDGLPAGQSYLETVAPIPAAEPTKREEW